MDGVLSSFSHCCSFRHIKYAGQPAALRSPRGKRRIFPFHSHLSTNTFPILDYCNNYSKPGQYRQLLYAAKTIFRRFVYKCGIKLGRIHNFLKNRRNFLASLLHINSFYANVSVKYSYRRPCRRFLLRNRPPAGQKKQGQRMALFAYCQRYISGFSMVSTFRNWLVPLEAFSASPATQAT